MYSFSILEPVCCSMSSSNCCFLTCIQISQEAGQVVWYSHLLKNFSQFVVIPIVKGFGIVNKAEVDVFLELSCFIDDPADVGNLISGSSVFSKSRLNVWKFTVHVLLKPGLENFEHYFTSVWSVCNCVVVWAFFGIAFLWDWNDKWSFPIPCPLLSFLNLLTYWVQHFHSIISSKFPHLIYMLFNLSHVHLWIHIACAPSKHLLALPSQAGTNVLQQKSLKGALHLTVLSICLLPALTHPQIGLHHRGWPGTLECLEKLQPGLMVRCNMGQHQILACPRQLWSSHNRCTHTTHTVDPLWTPGSRE